MSILSGISNFVGKIAKGLNPLTGIIDTVGGIANIGLQFQNLAYQKQMQRRAWAREDNAVQRRTADLRAAGLSPTLAAGQAAQSSNPVPTKAPEIESGLFSDKLSKALQIMQQKADISKTAAETAAVVAQREKTVSEARAIEISNAFSEARNPLELTGKRIAVEIAEATKPDAIAKIVAEAKAAGLEETNRKLDAEIKRQGVTKAQLDLIAQDVAISTSRIRLTEAEKDVAIKAATLKAKEAEARVAENDARLYLNVFRDVPSNQAMSQKLTTTGFFAGALSDLLKGGLNLGGR